MNGNLVNSFAKHTSDELEQRKVTVLHVGRRRRIQLLFLGDLPSTSQSDNLHG